MYIRGIAGEDRGERAGRDETRGERGRRCYSDGAGDRRGKAVWGAPRRGEGNKYSYWSRTRRVLHTERATNERKSDTASADTRL